MIRLSAITPQPTQRCIQRLRPWRPLLTLMRPSHLVRHRWPLRNAFAATSLLAE
jgi:hypothetical protein